MTDDDLPSAAPARTTAGLLDHVLSASVAIWLAMTLFLLISQARPQAGPSDTAAHVILFAGLTFTVQSFAWLRRLPRWLGPLPALAVLALAIASELVQGIFVPRRSGSFSDVTADAIGICLGIGVAAIVRLLPREGARVTAVLASALSASLIAGFVTVNFVRESAWWRCRDHGGAPIENSVTRLEDGPMIEFDAAGQEWQLPDGQRATGAAPPSRPTAVAWCSAIVSEEFTLAIVVDTTGIVAVPVVEIFGTWQSLGDATLNLKLEARADVLTVRARHRVREPRVTNFHFDDLFVEPGRQWIAVRYSDHEITFDSSDGQLLREGETMAFGAWSTAVPMDIPGEGAPGSGSVLYVGFFDRTLEDEELERAIDAVLGDDPPHLNND